MPAKAVLLSVFVLLALLTVFAVTVLPEKTPPGKVPLIWVSDANPERYEQVDLFNSLNPDLHLTVDPGSWGVMKNVVQCSAGMGGDMIDAINESNIQTYQRAGILLDITEEARAMGFGPETLAPSVRPTVMAEVLNEKGELEERQFTYPANVYHSFIYYNKNILDKLGVPYPPRDLTWEKYIELAQQLTITRPDSSIPEVFGAAGAGSWPLVWNYGGDAFNADGTRCTIGEKPYSNAAIFLHRLYYDFKVEPTPVEKAGVASRGGFGTGYLNWFGEGRVALFWGSRYSLIQLRRFQAEQREARAEYLKRHPDAKPDEGPQVIRFGCSLIPRFENGERSVPFGARCSGINAQGRHLKEALRALRFLSTPEYSETINRGADSKPGNVAYNRIELFRNPDFPGEDDVHEVALESLPLGRLPRRSHFLTNAALSRITSAANGKMIADPKLTPEEIATIWREAQAEAEREILTNIQRDRKLRKIYDILLAQGAEPIRFHEELEP